MGGTLYFCIAAGAVAIAYLVGYFHGRVATLEDMKDEQ